MKNIIFIIVAILMASVSSMACATELPNADECKKLEQGVKDYIVSQNHCEKGGDCVFVQQMCPFGCINYVHKDSINEVNKKMQDFLDNRCVKCIYDCMGSSGAICKNNKCVDKNMSKMEK